MIGPLFRKRVKEKPLAPFKTSPGKLKAYQQCGLKYKKTHVDGIRAEAKKPSPHLAFDAIVNAMVEAHQKKGTPLMKAFESAWDADKFPDEDERAAFYKAGCDAAVAMERWFRENRSAHPVTYQNKQAIGMFAPWYPRPLTIWTRLDRVEERPDGTLRAIDFKSGARELTAPELMLDMGVRLQAAAARELFGNALTHFALVYLRTGHTVEISLDELELDLLRADVNGIVKSIQNDRFEPNLGPLCSVCEFQPDCAGWRGKLPWKPIGETRDQYSERLRLSYSKMSLFERCPRAYSKLYNERIPPKPQPFFSFGSCIHAIMEEFFDPASREKPTWDRMMRIMEETWRHFRIGYRTPEEEERYRAQALRQLELYFNRFVSGQKFRPAYYIEKYFELPIGNDSIMTGFIDRIDKRPDGGYIVLDYKTEPTDRTQEAVDNDLQLTLYYWASREFLNLDIRELGLFMMSHDKLVTTKRTPDDIPALLNRVIEITGQIRAEKAFAPKKNKYCLSCDHLAGCPLENEIRSDASIRTMEFTDTDMTEGYENENGGPSGNTREGAP